MLGCWLKHHISCCPADQLYRVREGGEAAQSGVGRVSSHDPSSPCTHWFKSEKRNHLKNVSQIFPNTTVVTVETLSAESAVTPNLYCTQCNANSVTMACQSESGKSWKHGGHMDCLCFWERRPPNFLGIWEARRTKLDRLLFSGNMLLNTIIWTNTIGYLMWESCFCWRRVVIIKGWSSGGLHWIRQHKISFVWSLFSILAVKSQTDMLINMIKSRSLFTHVDLVFPPLPKRLYSHASCSVGLYLCTCHGCCQTTSVTFQKWQFNINIHFRLWLANCVEVRKLPWF